MEEYVSTFLEAADLSVITKKHVRQEYKNHLGRDLSKEERDRINDLVYCFISESASKQKDSAADGDSPGNKENVSKQSNSSSTTFILKGQVVDRKSLYSNKKDKDEKKQQAPPKDVPRGQQNGASDVEKSPQQKSSRKKRKDSLKLSDVVSSVLDSGSSAQEDGGGPESDAEMETLTAPQLKKALDQLKEARKRKIQLSQEKKHKFADSRKGDIKSPVVKRLPISGSRVDALKQLARPAVDTSDTETLSLISLSEEDETVNLSSGAVGTHRTNSRREEDERVSLPTRAVGTHTANSGRDTGERTDEKSDMVTENQTLDSADKDSVLELNNDLISTENSRKVTGKVKRKEISDDNSECSDRPDVKRRKSVGTERNRTLSENESAQKDRDNDSDGSVSTIDRTPLKDKSQDSNVESDLGKEVTPVRRTSRIRKPKPCSCGDVNCLSPLVKKSRNVKNKASNSSPGANPDSKDGGDDSDVSSDDMPLAKLRREAPVTVSDSDSSIDIPLAQMRKQYRAERRQQERSDSESSSSDEEPLVKKKKMKTRKALKTKYESDESVERTPVLKMKRKKQSVKHNDSDDESVERTPVLNKKRNKQSVKQNDSDDESVERTPVLNKKRNKQSVKQNDLDDESVERTPVLNKKRNKQSVKQYDSDESTGDTPLIKKIGIKKKGKEDNSHKNVTRKSPVKTKGKSKPEPDLDVDNTCDTPVVKKKGKHSKVKSSDSEDESAGDTPLIHKKGRRKNVRGSDQGSDTDGNVGDTPVVKKKMKTKVRQLGDSDCESERSRAGSCDTDSSRSRCSSPSRSRSGSHDTDSSRSRCSSPSSVSAKSDSNSETESPVKKKPASPKQVSDVDSSDVDTDDSEDVPLIKINETKQASSDSDEDEPLSKTKSKLAVKTNKAKVSKKADDEKSIHLVRLRKICKASGLVYWNDTDYKNCHTDKQKISTLKRILTKAGMQGRPSMKKAEEIKLRKEASELCSDNILNESSGWGKRKSSSLFSRRKASPKKTPKKPQTKLFAELKGIVDSEGSDSV